MAIDLDETRYIIAWERPRDGMPTWEEYDNPRDAANALAEYAVGYPDNTYMLCKVEKCVGPGSCP